jgi:transcriptional regulator with XRE-family HTH domain
MEPRDEAQLSEAFGRLLYRLREGRGLSQRAAARLIGVSQARLASLEQGRHANTGLPTLPSPVLVTKVAQVFQYPREELLLLAGYNPWLLDEGEAARFVSRLCERD